MSSRRPLRRGGLPNHVVEQVQDVAWSAIYHGWEIPMDSLMGNPHGTQWVMASMAILKNARGRLSKNVKKIKRNEQLG